MNIRACPACASKRSAALEKYSTPEWKIVACSDCDFVYLSNPANYKDLNADFAWEKTSVEERNRRRNMRAISARVSENTRWRLSLLRFSRTRFDHYFQSGKVLDIGCGTGHRIADTGGTPFGIEISTVLNERADELLRSRGGYSINAPAVEGVSEFPNEHFDAVLMHSFLEHESEPAKLLEGLCRITKPGGHAYVRVPNFGSINRMLTGKKWCGFRYPDHVNYFTISSLKALVENKGFIFRLLNPLNVFADDNIKALIVKP